MTYDLQTYTMCYKYLQEEKVVSALEIWEGFIKKDVCELDPERWAQTDGKERILIQGNGIGKAGKLCVFRKHDMSR